MICLTPKPSQSLYVYRIQSKDIFKNKNSFLRKKVSRRLNKKPKRRVFNSSRYGYKEWLQNVNEKAPRKWIEIPRENSKDNN